MIAKSFNVPALDGIRAIAFLLVFLAHAGLSRWIPGGFGVTVFFFLSGYLITTLLMIEGVTRGSVSLHSFYIGRAFRLLPPLLITLLLATLGTWCGLLRGTVRPPALIAAITYASNYYGLISHHSPGPVDGMGILWSLAVEEHFYLVFPLLFIVSMRHRISDASRSTFLLCACLTALLWRLALIYVVHVHLPTGEGSALTEGWTYLATDCRFDSIAWGCLLATYSNPWGSSFPDWLPRHKGVWAVSGLVVIVATLGYRNADFRETFRYTLQSAALYFIFFYLISTPSSRFVRLLSLWPLRWIGWVSYSLYLVHSLLLAQLSNYMRQAPAALCAFALALIYGSLIRSTIDLPMRALRNRLMHRPVSDTTLASTSKQRHSCV